MSRIDTNFKANAAGTTGAGDAGLAQLMAEVQEALREIEEFKAQNAEWLSEEHLNELDRLEVTLKAESAAMGAYGTSGAAGGSGAAGSESWLDAPDELQPEWNGIPDGFINSFDEDAAGLSDPKYGEYAGTIEIPNSGRVDSPTKIGFQMTDDMLGITAESKGRDIVITVRYDYDGDGVEDARKSWVIKEGTVRPEPIIISAYGVGHGVEIDCSRVIRINDGSYEGFHAGTKSGFYIHGSEYDDVIRGTQANDAIVGYAGDDLLEGQAGNDKLWGDEYYEVAGSFDPDYGGNDEINGGAGEDIGYGGGGIDTSHKADRGESITEDERSIDDVVTDAPPVSDWFQDIGGGDWEYEGMEDGVAVIRNTSGEAGELDIYMPPGYNMAYAERDADGSLIITFVGDEGTFKIKIEDFFTEFAGEDPDARIPRLNFIGSDDADIIDFSRVTVSSQVININGEGGDDIILGANSDLLKDGVDLDNMTSSQRNPALQNYIDDFFAYEDGGTGGYAAEVDGDQIHIGKDDGVADADRAEVLNICAPEGYEKAYIAEDPATGDLILILVKPGQGDEKAKTIVVRIDEDLGLDYNQISIFFAGDIEGEGEARRQTYTDGPIPTPVSISAFDYTLDGGSGADLLFNWSGGKTNRDSEDDVVEGDIDPAGGSYIDGSGNGVGETGGSEGGSGDGDSEGDGTGEGSGDGTGEGSGDGEGETT